MEWRARESKDIVRENGDNGEGPGGKLGINIASGALMLFTSERSISNLICLFKNEVV